VLVVLPALLVPPAASAQDSILASIAGVVKDASGAIFRASPLKPPAAG
jgi:hypothetical protein